MKVTELWHYPIKSCAGVSLTQSFADKEGFSGDRRFQWVLDNGRFVTQREFPLLALFRASWNDETLELRYGERLWCLSMKDFTEQRSVTIWSDEVVADAYNGSINLEVSEIIGVPVALVRMPYQGRPISDPRADGHVSFADGFPFLLSNMQSLAELNSRLVEPVTMSHFRANIVIDGEAPYQEDDWEKVTIGDVVFRLAKPCSRCVMTTINPVTAEKRMDAEPLKTLATYRMAEPGKIIFGMNMVVEEPGEVFVGDEVTLI